MLTAIVIINGFSCIGRAGKSENEKTHYALHIRGRQEVLSREEVVSERFYVLANCCVNRFDENNFFKGSRDA